MFIEYYDNGSAQLDGATRSNNHRNTNRLKENRKMFNDTTFNRTCLTAICIGVLMAVIMAAPVAANPDLIPVGFDMVGSEVYPGEALEERLYGSVANMTDAGAGPFQVAFFITLDTTNPSAG